MEVGAVFGMIFAIIVMGFIIYFGSGQIINIICMGNIGQTSKAIRNLEVLVDDIQASGEGSSDTYRMSIPTNARVCFIDPADPRPSITGGWLPDPDEYPVIEKKIQTGGYNTWIDYKCGDADPAHRMNYIVVDSNFCVGAGDTVLLTNIGIEVRIEKLTGQV